MGRVERTLHQVTSPLRQLPEFLIIGGIRCGTTSMIEYLGDHPSVGIPPVGKKELHFFDRHFDRGANWYRSWFPLKGSSRGTSGESSPTYLMEPGVPERVAGLLPDVRLIVMLRDPVERAASHFSLRRGKGSEPKSTLAATLEDEERRLQGSSRHPGQGGAIDCYFEQGNYIKGLRKWSEQFDREQMLVVDSAELFTDPGAVYDRTLLFLGLSPHRPQFAVHNATPRVTVEDETLSGLRERYRPLNAELEAEYGIRFD
ncbi:hypothetical protein BH23ACT4_BH23ACT4_15420 [soil metagenome]